MGPIDARASGQFKIGDTTINRVGYGAMRLTGPGIWGAPSDRGAALATLRRLHEIGVNVIDTADSYGPDVSEELIREALHPYEGLLIATKAGLTRPGPDQWIPNGRPAYLIAQAKGSLRKLGVEQIDLWQLHRRRRCKTEYGQRVAGRLSLLIRRQLSQTLVEKIAGPGGLQRLRNIKVPS